VGGQAVLGRQILTPTPWLTERHGYDPTLYRISSGTDKESNLLPLPADGFFLILRMYLPAEQVLNGTWTLPPLKVIE
ncbi:MAG: hypothetical protein QOK67_05775, partial [Nitrososphaeraceae archaeon]|nr:hypothetical protein [Nitrososphaeraceae archaeon]